MKCLDGCDDDQYKSTYLGATHCVSPQLCGQTNDIIGWVGDDMENSPTYGECIQTTACAGVVDSLRFRCSDKCNTDYYAKEADGYKECVLPVMCGGVGSEL